MLDGNRNVVLKFYDPESGKIKLARDSSYAEYSYAEPSYHKLGEIDPDKQIQAEKTDPVTGEKLQLVKAYARGWSFGRHDVESGVDANGNTILETKKSNQVWESDIKPYESYLHDRDLSVGLFYDITGKPKKIDMPVPENVNAELRLILDSKESGEFKKYLEEWADSLSQPIPHLRRVAVDIEVDVPRGQTVESLIGSGSSTITAISFKGDGVDRVLALDPSGETTDCGDFELHSYLDEPAMLRAAFKIIEEFPVILTYNGTNFDLPYLAARANTLEAYGGGRFDVPFEVRKISGSGQATHIVSFRKCVHVDLYQIMDNKAFQVYVFDNKYSKKGLGDVSRAILGRGKIEYDVFAKHPVRDLAKYCYNDSLLTYDLTAHENDMLMNMLVIIARIARMPLDDVARYRVSQWVRSRLYYDHRRSNILIPNRHDLEARSQGVMADAKIKGKKYQGGLVIEPHPGIYFDVMVVDFASLYPSIVKSYNISYETVRCPHEECHSNMLPLTNHWCCTKKYGITSLMIGSLRDLRVQYYKRLSKDDSIPEGLRFQYSAVAQALKVILNASYGVMGADIFPLYFLPAAEATTAIGRHTIQGTIDACKEAGIRVLYGDSVPGDTPITCERNGVRQIVPIQSLIAPSVIHGRQKHAALKVLSDDGFVDVKYSYVHKVRKTGYRIGTRKSYVEVTDDHSLVVGGREVKPHQLKIGDSIDISDQSVFKNDHVLSDDMAWLFGFYLSDGTLGEYVTQRMWKIVKNDKTKLEKAQRIIFKHLGFQTKILNYPSSKKLHTLVSADKSVSTIIEYFKYHCYSSKIKIIPGCVLNGTRRVKTAFMQGLVDGDGHVNKKDKSVVFGQVHKSILAGYISIVRALGYDYSLKFRKDKPNYIGIRIIRNTNDARIRPADTIVLLEPFKIDTYVYDLSTHNEHFRGGLGNVLLHNTDSVFLLAPTDGQIESIISEAREKYRVDLEVDKSYKFCVFSERKKNYYGVLDSGKIDIKGLVGKKSHTPRFVKELFSDVLRELARITCRDDTKPILKRVIGMVRKRINDVRDGKIPLEAMAFTTLLGTQLENYSVLLKTGDVGFIPGTAPGKHPLKNVFDPDAKCPLDARVYSRVPLHVKAALWTCREPGDVNYTNTREKAVDMLAGSGLKKGDGVSYIKMTDPVVALPLGMFGDASDAGAEWRVPERFRAEMERREPEFGLRTCTVDVEKYVEMVITTLGPLLEPLGVVLKSKHSAKPAKHVPVSKHAAKTDIKTASSLSFFMD